jgi:flagellar basal-body rod modification protein FlgD
VSAINGISSGQSTDKMPGTDTKNSNNVGQDAFMTLLTTQLKNQDPLKPQENGEFLAQLAQFTSLEKLTSIEASMKEMAAAFAKLADEPTSADTSTTGNTSTGSGQ